MEMVTRNKPPIKIVTGDDNQRYVITESQVI